MSTQSIYDVSLAQATNMIRLAGHQNTTLMQGHMGTGKSSMLKKLSSMLPTHKAVYFDCTTKDLGDITIPKIGADGATGNNFVQYVPNEELGLHLDGPIILMIDEYGKANPAVKTSLLRLMLERKLAGYTLHPDSIVFATTNLGSEGVGDLLPAHARNRITVLRVRKPTVVEWIEDFALEAGVDPIVLSWVTENPHVFASFEDVVDPKDNEYIFHPKAAGRVSFVTPRTLELASNWLKQREHMSSHELTAALIGTLGQRAASDLAAYVTVALDMPRLDEIKANPMTCRVPTNNSVVCMVVHRTLSNIERNWTDAWMDYMMRLPAEAQGMFANAVRRSVEKDANGKPKSKRLMEVFTNKKYMDWSLKNNHLFASDKR
jgi:hypothetical protein